MPCTCRIPARCTVCNATVHVPLSTLESASGATVMLERAARRDTAVGREGLQRLVRGTIRCPVCGNSVQHSHSRSCVSEYLAGIGVSPSDRASLLARISFPED
jgi:hypothetical protein